MKKPRSSTSTSTPRTRSSEYAVTLLARQSSSRDERDPASQFEHSEHYADSLGWSITTRYVEKSISGTRKLEDRPGLLSALEDVKRKLSNRVLVYDRDRLDRNAQVRRAFVEAVEEAGGEVWSARQGRITFSTATDKLTQTQAAAMDEHYADSIREKVALQKRARLEKGYPVTALPKIGYLAPGGETCAQVIENDRPHVVRMFELAADGKSSRDIKLYLQGEGYDVTHSMVTKWLRNEVFCGHLVWGELRHDNAHEAIVSDRLWRRVQARRAPVGRKPNQSPALLARLEVARCATCGYVLSSDHKMYRCPNRDTCDARANIMCSTLERIVLDEVGRALRGMRGHANDVLGPLLEEQERASVALDKVRRLGVLADDLEGMATQIREAKERLARASAAVDDARAVEGVSWSVGSTWEHADFDGMSRDTLRDVIQTMCEVVTVARRGTVEEYDRVSVKLHEAFDVQPMLDAAARTWAEIIPLLSPAVEITDGSSLREAAAS